MVQRLTFRRRHSYNTKSNGVTVVKTPGGQLKVQYRAKLAKGPSCGDCGCSIQGIPHLRPVEYARLAKHERTVSRAYGGSRCATCVRNRIVRAFLVEEQRVVKSVISAKAKEAKAAEKAEKNKKPTKK